VKSPRILRAAPQIEGPSSLNGRSDPCTLLKGILSGILSNRSHFRNKASSTLGEKCGDIVLMRTNHLQSPSSQGIRCIKVTKVVALHIFLGPFSSPACLAVADHSLSFYLQPIHHLQPRTVGQLVVSKTWHYHLKIA
jgi:hypothetical protein